MLLVLNSKALLNAMLEELIRTKDNYNELYIDVDHKVFD